MGANVDIDEPDALRFLECPEGWQREPEGDECVLCGSDPDPYTFDYIPVETPDGGVHLNVSDPSCMECRKDVIRELAARGLDQQSLDTYR
jgi:hypothetical protein